MNSGAVISAYSEDTAEITFIQFQIESWSPIGCQDFQYNINRNYALECQTS